MQIKKVDPVQEDNQNSIFTPSEIGVVLLTTFVVFVIFALIAGFLGESLSLLFGELLMVLPAVVFALLKRMPFMETFRLRRISLRGAAATLVLFIPVFILSDELDRLLQMFFPMPAEWFESLYDLVKFNSIGDAVAILLAGVIFASVSEEMLFRGVLQNTLEHYRDPAMAIVSSAVFFALVHFNPWTSIQILLLGLVFGYVTWKSQSILPSIILHALNNLASLLMMNAPEQSLAWYAGGDHVNWWWLGVGAVLLAPAFRWFVKSCK